ncbi:restriction endonuclease subunit S [Streptomyces sp. NPDC014894]|uniref:restriction endonuclease subunit S n=1 Tax=Streptomyces sp. NPDC014894 TaxID=3364931 RepID=UPI0036FA6A79
MIDPSILGDNVVHYSIPAIDQHGAGQIEETASIQSAKLQLRGGEVLISKLNPRKSRVVHVARHDFPVVSSTEFVALQANSGIGSKFLAYTLQAESTRQALNAQVQSVTRSHQRVAPEDVTHLKIDLPPLDEQCRITDFLDVETARIDHLIKLKTSQLESIGERMLNALSRTASELEDKHGTVKVRHVLQKIEQGWSPQCEDRLTEEGEWGVVKAGCVNGGTFDEKQHKTLPASISPDFRYRLRVGDLLMSRASGSVELIGSIGVLPEGSPPNLLLCDKIYRLRMDRTRMNSNFVALMLRTYRVREEIKLGISGADGMANNLPTATVTNLPLPDVPLAKQGHIVDELQSQQRATQAAQQLLESQLSVLAERRQALVTAAVAGEFDVSAVRHSATFGGVA